METTYTVDESDGSVEVCVNLIRPTFDILDETVNVFVIDDPSSVYIPPGGPLASKSNHNNHKPYIPLLLSLAPDPPTFLSEYKKDQIMPSRQM